MEIIDLKSIPIDKLMSNLGYEPVTGIRRFRYQSQRTFGMTMQSDLAAMLSISPSA